MCSLVSKSSKSVTLLSILIILNIVIQIHCQFQQINEKIQNSYKPRKFNGDNREYQFLILQNQLKLMIISDPQSAKSACAITVNAASLQEPERSQGLAHFLQHMLLMGSKKFPGANEYKEFISVNSGSTNAQTGDYLTSYYFDVKSLAFFEAVQRLTNFFSGALLKQSQINKEIHAVDQQYNLRLSSDAHKTWYAVKLLAEPPLSYFDYGNLEYLNHSKIRDDLIQFYNTYYSSNLITAVLYTNYTIEETKQEVLDFFAQIPNKKAKLPNLGQLFKQQNLQKLILLQSIQDHYTIQFDFVGSPFRNKRNYKKHIDQYIDYVVNNQGSNTLISVLKYLGYASIINVSYTHLISQQIIKIQVKLTPKGYQNYQQVYNIVMDYLSKLVPEPYIYDQLVQKSKLNLYNLEKGDPLSYSITIATKMQYIQPKDVLVSSVLYQSYATAAKGINAIFRTFREENLIVVVSGHLGLQDYQFSQIFNNRYKIQDLPIRKKSGTKFQKLPKNPYLPVTINSVRYEQKKSLTPKQINQNIYFLQDSSFKVDKGAIELRVYGEQTYAFLFFYKEYFKQLIKQVTYPAEVLGTSVSYRCYASFTITLYGFTDVISKLLTQMSSKIKEIHRSKYSKLLFKLAISGTLNIFYNYEVSDTNQYATYLLEIIETRGETTIQQTIEEIQSYNYEDMLQRIQDFWSRNKLQWIIVGNFDERNILQRVARAQRAMHKMDTDLQINQLQTIKLTRNITHHVLLESTQIKSSCSLIYYQAGQYTQKLYYTLLMLQNYLRQPFYTQLRSQKKLAYYLDVIIDRNRGVLGLYFILVSSVRNPKAVGDMIEDFVGRTLREMGGKLKSNNFYLFKLIKQSVFTDLFTPHTSIFERLSFISRQVYDKTFFFQRKQQKNINRYLQPITVEDLIQTFKDIITNSIKVYVVSKIHQEEYLKYEIKSESIEQIRNMSQFWEDFLNVG